MEHTYLWINICTVIVPFIFSFHPKIQFYKTWKAFFPAVVLTGTAFLLWDNYFTGIGVWGFNSQYLTGWYIGNLPLEEILFFFCIPYACVFTYYCLSPIVYEMLPPKAEGVITIILILFLLSASLYHSQKIYTVVTFTSLSILLITVRYFLRINWLPEYYIVYTILLVPFFLVNGLLTGTGLSEPVVWYNEMEIIGIRLLTIPVEDIFYGMELILINLVLYNHLNERSSTNISPPTQDEEWNQHFLV